MYEKALINAGLNEKQARVYLACLASGGAKVPEIARRAELKRSTTYGIIDELVRMGIIRSGARAQSKIFIGEEPRSILALLEDRKKEFEKALPHLEGLFATHQLRPHINFFEGKEGIKRIYEDTLRCRSKKLLQIVRVRDFIDFPGGDFSKEYIRRRAEKGVIAYALHPKSGDIHDTTYGEHSERWKRYVRYLPPDMFYASMIMIYDNKVAMISTRAANFGFIIESKEFTNTLRAYFEFMWGIGSKEPE